MTGRTFVRGCAVISAMAVVAGLMQPAAAATLVHEVVIDLGDVFNSVSGYGDNPLSVAFDGTNAYVGGFKSTAGSAATVGVIKVENVVGGGVLSKTLLVATQFTSPNLRGIDAVAFHAGDIYLAHDSGAAGTSFITRRRASDGAAGAAGWTVTSPQNARPFAMAIDPQGNAGNPGVAFLTQGSGRRRLLGLDGSTINDGSNGGIINTSPDSGSTWRAMAFDSDGNIVVANQNAYGYGERIGTNQWQTLAGAANLSTRSVLKSTAVNNVGQGIVILEDVGSDLIAFSARGANQALTDSLGGSGPVSSTAVHIRNLDGSTAGLLQTQLTGDENGIGSSWTGELKNFAFGVDAAGRAVLLVVDFAERRLDVYAVPEPAAALLGLAALGITGRRRRRAIP